MQKEFVHKSCNKVNEDKFYMQFCMHDFDCMKRERVHIIWYYGERPKGKREFNSKVDYNFEEG